MTPLEILAYFNTAKSIYDFAMTQYRLAQQNGTLTPQQQADILAAAKDVDNRLDQLVEAAKARLESKQ